MKSKNDTAKSKKDAAIEAPVEKHSDEVQTPGNPDNQNLVKNLLTSKTLYASAAIAAIVAMVVAVAQFLGINSSPLQTRNTVGTGNIVVTENPGNTAITVINNPPPSVDKIKDHEPKKDLILKGPDGRELKMSEWQSLANNGDPAACVVVGVWYTRGEYGIPQDDKEAYKLFRKAAELGNPDGCFNLGLNYFNGWGIPKDENEAAKWWHKAAEKDHTRAQSMLGAMYFQRWDFEEAEQYLRLAAKKKDAQALYFLGAGYLTQKYTMEGRYNVDENEEYGFQLLIESMKQGNKDAITMLELYKDNASLSRLLRDIPPFFGNEL